MVTIIEQSTAEREQEIIDIFNKIKPLLDEGHSYASAIKMVNPSLYRSKKVKEIKDYGETQGYSRNSFSRRTGYLSKHKGGNKNKHGLLNVILIKNSRYLTGYMWRYNYFENECLKTISNANLIELRRKVEEKNLEWKVTDLEKARIAYDFNRKLQENSRQSKKKNHSGIYRVSKGTCYGCSQGFTWQYSKQSKGGIIYITSVDPKILKDKVLNAGEEWIVLDEDKARENGLL